MTADGQWHDGFFARKRDGCLCCYTLDEVDDQIKGSLLKGDEPLPVQVRLMAGSKEAEVKIGDEIIARLRIQ